MSEILAPAEDTHIQPSAHAPLAFDPQTYRHFLDDTDWTDAQKDEFISALWKIIVSVIDYGFDQHPVQQAIANRARTLELESSDVVASLLNSKKTETHVAPDFNRAAAGRMDS